MLQLSERAHPVLAEDGGAVLNAGTGRWTHLTPVAAAAVMIMCSTNTEDEAAEQYAARYGLPVDRARVDLQTVRDALKAAGLTTTAPARGRRWRRWRR